MNREIVPLLKYNSADYFQGTLISENGFREYDVRWLLGKEINPNGFLALGKAYGTFAQRELNESHVLVGYDFREYNQDLSRSFVVGLMSTGVRVIDVGLAGPGELATVLRHLFQPDLWGGAGGRLEPPGSGGGPPGDGVDRRQEVAREWGSETGIHL